MEIYLSLDNIYGSETDEQVAIGLATSADGVDWRRRGIVLSPSIDQAEAAGVHTCASSG